MTLNQKEGSQLEARLQLAPGPCKSETASLPKKEEAPCRWLGHGRKLSAKGCLQEEAQVK